MSNFTDNANILFILKNFELFQVFTILILVALMLINLIGKYIRIYVCIPEQLSKM